MSLLSEYSPMEKDTFLSLCNNHFSFHARMVMDEKYRIYDIDERD